MPAMAKYLVPVLAFAGIVFAQTSTVCDGPSLTITNQADASQISSCGVYDGDIIIDSSATGNINLDGVQQITGSLTAKNVMQLTALNANTLSTIGNTFDLENMTTLSTLNMPYLRAVETINWIGIPNLQQLNFQTGVQQSNTVVISNTQLNTLEGIELTMVGSIDINNNPYLNDINVNGLKNITKALSFSANGQNLDVSFPNLQNAGNLTFRNVSSVSMPSLSTVGGSLGMYSDYFLNFSAPNLSTIGLALAFIDCAMLQTFSFPQLTAIGGGFIVVNNSNLDAIQNIPKLQTIGGAIDFVGTFDSFDAKSLKDVRGAVNVVTSSQNASLCTLFNQAKGNAIKGNVMCKTNTVTSQTNGSSSGSDGTKNAATMLSIAPAVPFTSFIGFVAYMLL